MTDALKQAAAEYLRQKARILANDDPELTADLLLIAFVAQGRIVDELKTHRDIARRDRAVLEES